ncbi:phosphoribosylaminoimidazolesuccinocarboxamide synthase [Paenibacillus sp. 481]|uniref:phosphoribosylaminoimidazolesuccinocarboxamide synthase n=1 Tax=Paenibacillus sp. 481 TaxID=2835869 RepID=UPI001E4673D9|nr:phosphoribosylaminoimidazolesuccinocarboxamide synthase [Paenibacillus sp. 481]UHA74726.1 phosphoribosylaminoimidazolesuccinocarboxamide synthase [Paenibacillus sp. 481]
MSTPNEVLPTASALVPFPLIHRGKVRELYELDHEHLLIVVTDRISAFDVVLKPEVPDKGRVLNRLSTYWFERTQHLISNHVVHTEVEQLQRTYALDESPSLISLNERIVIARRAKRIDFECVVRGYLTGGGWRQYEQHQVVNGIELPAGLRKNTKLAVPIFTPARKNDLGHDEDVPFETMCDQLGHDLAERLRQTSIALYEFAARECASKGILLADCKFEFGLIDGEIILIDELFTPDAARFWLEQHYALDVEIESLDKEPVRSYLANSGWDKESTPEPLPNEVVEATRKRYVELYERITGEQWS